MKRLIAILLIGCALGGALAVPVLADGSAMAMLDRLQKGAWDLRFRDESTSPKRLCIGNGRQFIQLRHPSVKCSHVVVEDEADEVTVQYTCPGKGYGRTNVRRESDRLVQIDSQGIENGVPFAFAAEARYVGRCGQ